MPFASFCLNAVTIQAVGTANAAADDVRVPSPGTPLWASVQQAAAVQQRDLYRAGARAAFAVLFNQEPLDTSAGADHARLRHQDLITWYPLARPGSDPSTWTQTDPATWRVLTVNGPARDEGGAGVAWSVDCEEAT